MLRIIAVAVAILLAGVGGALGFAPRAQDETDGLDTTWRIRESADFVTPAGSAVGFELRGSATVEDRDVQPVDAMILRQVQGDHAMAVAMDPRSGIEISRVECRDPCREASRSWITRGEPAWFGLVAYAAGSSGPVGSTIATWLDDETLTFERVDAPEGELVASVHGPLIGGWPSRIVTTKETYNLVGVSGDELEVPFPTGPLRQPAESILDARPFERNLPPEGERLREYPLIEEAIAGATAPWPGTPTTWIQYGFSSMQYELNDVSLTTRDRVEVRIEAGTTATTIQGEHMVPGLSVLEWTWTHATEAIEASPDACRGVSVPLWDAARLAEGLGYVRATQYLLFLGSTECIVHVVGDPIDPSGTDFIALGESLTLDANSGLLIAADLDPPDHLR